MLISILSKYIKVRRQGRKGDVDPFLLNNINTLGGGYHTKDVTTSTASQDILATTVNSQIEKYDSEPTTTTKKARRRILIFLKYEASTFDPSVLEIDLERELLGDVSIFLNQDQDLIKEIVTGNPNSVILNLSVSSGNELAGNIFSGGVPLEDLEGGLFEEALNILNTTRTLLENIIMSSKTERNIDVDKKIIVMVNSVLPISEEVMTLLKTRLQEAFPPPTVIVILINQSQEVLNQQYKTDKIPILVTITVDSVTQKLSGNLYYGSEGLENIQDLEKRNDAFEILDIVKSSLETNFIPQNFAKARIEAEPEENSFDFYQYESSAVSEGEEEAGPAGHTQSVDDYFMADQADSQHTENYLHYQDQLQDYDDERSPVGVTNSPLTYEDVDFGLIQEITSF